MFASCQSCSSNIDDLQCLQKANWNLWEKKYLASNKKNQDRMIERFNSFYDLELAKIVENDSRSDGERQESINVLMGRQKWVWELDAFGSALSYVHVERSGTKIFTKRPLDKVLAKNHCPFILPNEVKSISFYIENDFGMHKSFFKLHAPVDVCKRLAKNILKMRMKNENHKIFSSDFMPFGTIKDNRHERNFQQQNGASASIEERFKINDCPEWFDPEKINPKYGVVCGFSNSGSPKIFIDLKEGVFYCQERN